MDLAEVLAMTNYSEQRACLRKMAKKVVKHSTFGTMGGLAIRDVFTISPLIGTRENQVSVLPSVSGIIDNLNVPTLKMLAQGSIGFSHILDAIQDPVGYGLTDESTKTGYAFGQPIAVTITPLVDEIEAVLKPTPEPVAGFTMKYTIDTALTAQIDTLAGVLTAGKDVPKFSTLIDEVNSLTDELAQAREKKTPLCGTEIAMSGDVRGEAVLKPAHELFDLPRAEHILGFKVPAWIWTDNETGEIVRQKDVPVVDPDYIWNQEALLMILYSILHNEPAYLQGHTGSGKTTMIQQVAARLNWPFLRVNFDSEISRMDLIGRDVLTTSEEGATVSHFVEGILPKMMSGPYIGCFDEIDFVRPDVAYVMQRTLEDDGGLVLTEDGGRTIEPHAGFRIFATANTVGQGDEHGMYQGARPQSLAFLDRFKKFILCEYMDAGNRMDLLKAKVPEASEEILDMVSNYAEEHIEAFTTAKVLQPLSPRGIISLARTMAEWIEQFPATDAGKKMAIECAVNSTLLNRATEQDRAVLQGIVDRIFVTY